MTIDKSFQVIVLQGNVIVHNGKYKSCQVTQNRTVTPEYKIGEMNPTNLKVEKRSQVYCI